MPENVAFADFEESDSVECFEVLPSLAVGFDSS